MSAAGAHATVLVVAGHRFAVRRSFALICRVEERFGPIRELADRLGLARLTAHEMAGLYQALLADFEDVPQPMIEHHIMQAGLARCIQDIAPMIEAFFVGEERFMQRVAGQGDGSRPPMPEADLSPGAISSGPLQESVGSRGSSGGRPSTSLPPRSPHASMRANGQTAGG